MSQRPVKSSKYDYQHEIDRVKIFYNTVMALSVIGLVTGVVSVIAGLSYVAALGCVVGVLAAFAIVALIVLAVI